MSSNQDADAIIEAEERQERIDETARWAASVFLGAQSSSVFLAYTLGAAQNEQLDPNSSLSVKGAATKAYDLAEALEAERERRLNQ